MRTSERRKSSLPTMRQAEHRGTSHTHHLRTSATNTAKVTATKTGAEWSTATQQRIHHDSSSALLWRTLCTSHQRMNGQTRDIQCDGCTTMLTPETTCDIMTSLTRRQTTKMANKSRRGTHQCAISGQVATATKVIGAISFTFATCDTHYQSQNNSRANLRESWPTT